MCKMVLAAAVAIGLAGCIPGAQADQNIPVQIQGVTVPSHPVVKDCVHVQFPQCSEGN